MRLGVIGLASSHVDQVLRLAAAGALGADVRVGALGVPEAEPVGADRVEALLRAARGDRTSGADGGTRTRGTRSAGGSARTEGPDPEDGRAGADGRDPAIGSAHDDGPPPTPALLTGDPALLTGDPTTLAAALADRVDAVLLTTRDARTHRALADPLLRAGIPLLVDKPFTADPDDAAHLVRLADRLGVPLTSSSALRWHPETRAARLRWADEPGGIAVSATGPADPADPHGGLAGYAVHAVEAALSVLRAVPAPGDGVTAAWGSGSRGSAARASGSHGSAARESGAHGSGSHGSAARESGAHGSAARASGSRGSAARASGARDDGVPESGQRVGSAPAEGPWSVTVRAGRDLATITVLAPRAGEQTPFHLAVAGATGRSEHPITLDADYLLPLLRAFVGGVTAGRPGAIGPTGAALVATVRVTAALVG